MRQVIGDQPGVTEKRMFGGLAWLVPGHMAVVALNGGGLMVRVARADHDAMLGEPRAATMVMRGQSCGAGSRWPSRSVPQVRT